jgi:hypothetical protein
MATPTPAGVRSLSVFCRRPRSSLPATLSLPSRRATVPQSVYKTGEKALVGFHWSPRWCSYGAAAAAPRLLDSPVPPPSSHTPPPPPRSLRARRSASGAAVLTASSTHVRQLSHPASSTRQPLALRCSHAQTERRGQGLYGGVPACLQGSAAATRMPSGQ